MKPERLTARTLMGIETRASNDSPQTIGETWQRFMAERLADDIPSRADDCLIAAYYDYEGDHTKPYTFFVGCEVVDVACAPDGFVLKEIPANDYVPFPARGDMPQALIETWQRIWASDLQRNYNIDFELHNPAMPDEVMVYVGVQ
ncbi:Bacterial transcription activator, effector binding domain [Novipirellula aureliae]|uniref:Bacterial transcription activator, effector binding domain n=1 Tax=Novipirellula aureliae TaxID=2527966 RepID=A0A5C6EA54_9BACT|nr:GyrI-like domain-containing protein [Novipirellula aureliae]TWU45892.1 Bacterial transcription activator, effector binding domain [Novipirellula aureliae]